MTSPSTAVIQSLANQGVEVIFSLSGNQIMPLYDACIDANIRIIHTRHEGAAVYMAEAYAQFSGKIGVALVTAGPGLLNAVSALYSAARSETPLLLISGDAASRLDGQGAFQELDQISVTRPITKFSARPTQPEEMLPALEKTITTALAGTPGPVHLALPFDLLSASNGLSASIGMAPLPPIAPTVASGLSTTQTAELTAALQRAERPIVITGPQCNQSRQPAANAALSAGLGMPLICLESARGLADTFYGDFPTILASADLIILLGKLGDYATGLLTPGRISSTASVIAILTDDQPAPTQNMRPITLMRVGAITAAMQDLAAVVTAADAGWAAEVESMIARRKPWTATGTGRHPAAVASSLQSAMDSAMDSASQPILVADGGEFCQWIQAGCTANTRMINGPSGAIGGGICYAIGASIARPEATIFLTMGDGTAGFYLAEFNTAVRAGCSIVALIGNDYRWNAEVQIQIDNYGADRVYGCDLDATANYADAAAGLGADATTIDAADDLDAALALALKKPGVSCLNILIDSYTAPKFIPMKL
jgi:acetolactate synthase-1/2/3 large subunit